MAKSKKKSNLMSRLKALQKDYKKATPKRFGKQAPDGDYEGEIISCVIEESKNGNLMVVWTIKAEVGEKEKEIRKMSMMNASPDSLDYLLGEFEVLGVETPDDIADFGDACQETVGILVSITLRTKDGFQNVDFNDVLESDDEEEEEESEEEESEEEEDDEEEEEEEDDEDEDKDEDEELPSEKEVNKMKKPELLELIENFELDIEDAEDLSIKKLRATVNEAIEELEDEEEEEEEE